MNAARPVVLTFIHYYLPGEKSGGPVRTIANMVEALGDELDFRIVTADRDVGDAAPYPQLAGREGWLDVGKARVRYLPPTGRRLPDIARLIRQTPHSTLYLNSFFDPVFTIRPLLARWLGLAPAGRCVIAPRGEFSPGALQLKGTRKRAYLAASRTMGLYRDLTWQASSPLEATSIEQGLGQAADYIRIAPNLPASMAEQTASTYLPRAPDEPLRVVFLSRISPMKNLDFALEVLRQVRVPLNFDIYGQLEDPVYWRRCQDLMAAVPGHVSVNYRGPLEHRDVAATLSRYDLFFLPTRGENYGHAIVESLAAGTPVLISDATPWRGLANDGVGWELPLAEQASFVACLENAAGRPQIELDEQRRHAASFYRRLLSDPAARAASLALFGPLSIRDRTALNPEHLTDNG